MAYLSSDKLSSSRIENSLQSLTKRFFIYLEMTYPEYIDTNNLASFLCVSKRRVYDVLNILEGLGYLKKRSVNNLEWIGGNFKGYLQDKENIENKNFTNDPEILELEKEEKELDKQISEYNFSVQNILQQELSIKNAFVNNKEILDIPTLNDKLVFVVKAPPETFLENKDTKEEYAIEMNVNNDKIDVFFISDES